MVQNDFSYNDYYADSNSALTLKDGTAINIGTEDSGSSYSIGEEITYQIILSLNEGITKNIVVNNDLPAGMQFVVSKTMKANSNTTLLNTIYPEMGFCDEFINMDY
ncbi:MAG: hypothetical protein U5K53_08575 [Halanaerobiales bacterium]|nr:hypothetical protein [Halanaerobiales bacterium]